VFLLSHSLLKDRLGAAQAQTFAATMVLLLAVNPYFGYWAFSGMEALTGAGLACVGVTIANRRPLKPVWLLLGAAVAGAAPLLRPEMGFFSILLGLVLAWRLVQMRAGLVQKFGLLSAGIVLIAAPFGLWARYALHTFGSVLPTTNAAKRASPDSSVLAHLAANYTLGFPLVLVGLLLLTLWILASSRERTSTQTATPWSVLPLGSWVAIVWTLTNCFFYVVNHTYVQTRYIVVNAPVTMIVLLAAARLVWPRASTVLIGTGFVFACAISGLAAWPSVSNRVLLNRDYKALAQELRSLPADAPVAHYSIGEATFLSEHPIIDTGGILLPGIVPYLDDVEDTRRVQWMIRQGAQYVVTTRPPVAGSTIVWQQTVPAVGWFIDPRRYRDTDSLILWKLPSRTAVAPR